MKTLIVSSILSLFFLCPFTVLCQTYYDYTTRATALYQDKKYEESSKLWDMAFEVHNGFSTDYYNSACANALAGNIDKAFDHLENAIRRGWEDINWMKEDRDLVSLKRSKEWLYFIENIPELQEEYRSSLNIDMQQKLENLRMQDQTIRLLLPDAEKRFGRESEEYKWFRNELMRRNDSVVLDKVTDILDKQGWLAISEVGELANQTLWLVIQHAPLEIQEKYFALLEESVEKGESKAQNMAFLQDRILMRKDKKQIYGTQSLWDKEKMKNVIWPIEDYKTVNKRRQKVGLERIEDYANNNGFLYEPELEN